jgi:hypothetical protein
MIGHITSGFGQVFALLVQGEYLSALDLMCDTYSSLDVFNIRTDYTWEGAGGVGCGIFFVCSFPCLVVSRRNRGM